MTARKTGSKLIIGPIRMSFPWLHAPQPPMEGEGEGKYGVVALFPPGYDLQPIIDAMVGAAKEKWGPDEKKWPRLKFGPRERIKSCEEKADLAGYLPGWHFVGLNSKSQPHIVDAKLEPVGDDILKREAYGGRWARLSANPYAWDTGKGVRGVSLGLNNVQLLAHDEPFAGKPRATDDFDEVLEDMNSAQNWNG